jgi:hypothetical protein
MPVNTYAPSQVAEAKASATGLICDRDLHIPGQRSNQLHAHDCSECGLLRGCVQDPCEFRGRYTRRSDDKQFVCFVCVDRLAIARENERLAKENEKTATAA